MENIQNMVAKVAVVTGSSNGIGLATARLLYQKGWIVYGLDVVPSNSDALTKSFVIDVIDSTAVKTAVDTILETHKHIDVLVANAGQSYTGAVEKVNIELAKLVFDANFFGQVYCINAVIPTMREYGGTIICVGSIAGSIAPPFLAFYNAAKAAVESFAKSVRAELEPFGIKVSVVIPGIVKTKITQNRIKDFQDNDEIYGDRIKNTIDTLEKKEATADDATQVAKTIYKIVNVSHPKPTYTVGATAKATLFANNVLPNAVTEIVGTFTK